MKRMATRIRTEAAMDQFLKRFNISTREKEVILLILKGMSNKEIESHLYIALCTVRNHIYNIYKKLGIQNRSQLIRLFKNFK